MEFEYVPLGEVTEVTKLAGFEFTKYIKYNDSGEIIALRALNLRHGELDLTDVKRIDRAISDFLPRSKLYIGDILLTYTGNGYGDCALIKENNKYHLAPNICKITPNTEKIDPYFLYSYVRSTEFYQQMSNHMVGSSQPTIPMKTIRILKVPVPSLETQKKIKSVISTLDVKIRINQSINDNLQEQAQTLFAERFCLRNSDPVPEGWSLVSLGDVAVISNKSFNPLKQPETMLEHYSIPAFDEKRYPVFELSTEIKSNKFIVDSDCFMISKLNPTTKRVWRPYCMTENAVCSTEFIVYKAKVRELTDFLYSLIDSASFSDFMCSHVTGSTGSRQRTTPSDTLQYQFYMPTADEIADFSAVVAPMYAQIRINAMENARLKGLRDSLLPRLMSGEIDVADIDA